MKKIVFLFWIIIAISCEKDLDSQKINFNIKEVDSLNQLGFKYSEQDQIDSAYYYFQKALKIRIALKDTLGIEKSNINLLSLELKMNDFPSCESRCVRALQFGFKNNDYEKIATAYNNLSLSAKSQKKYAVALDYIEKYKKNYQLNFVKDSMEYFITYQNNKGNIYLAMHEETNAIDAYSKIIHIDSIIHKAPVDYARAIDNMSKAYLNLNQPHKAYPLIVAAHKIRENLNNPAGLVMSYLHYSEFFIDKNESDSATYYAQKGLQLCRKINNKRDELEFLKLLSISDERNMQSYFKRFVAIKDSLLFVERQFKDQTARIRFETLEKEQEIAIQKSVIIRRNRSLAWGSGFLLLTLISASIFWKQKNRINSQKLVVESQNKLVKSMHEEIHHRTKNNLLKINDFIAKKEKDYPVFSKELTNSVNSMLFVHTQLLDHPDKNEIDMQTYFQDISNHLVQTYQEEDKLISCNIDAPIWMDNKKAQHIGLILNELLTNTYKYAFPNKKNGNIMITMEQKDHQIVMAYKDDGIGLSQDFNIMNLHSFGLKMVQGIVCQLDGTLDILNNENGFALKITLNI